MLAKEKKKLAEDDEGGQRAAEAKPKKKWKKDGVAKPVGKFEEDKMQESGADKDSVGGNGLDKGDAIKPISKKPKGNREQRK